MAKNYVNNADFYEAMVEYKRRCLEAEDAGDELPKIPEYIGKCFFQIATRLSFKHNFINYSYKDDMISDGIENAIIAVHNFDPEKSKNPFAYFTQVIWFAFIRRIQKEQKQTYVKHKVIENSVLMGTAFEESEHSKEGDTSGYIDLNTDYMNGFVENYEAGMERKKKKKEISKKGLEKFYDD